MKNLKIITTVFLCLVLAACAKENETEEKSPVETGGLAGTEAAEEIDPDAPELPAGIDMEGKTFTFLTAGWGESNLSSDISPEAQTGDPVNDAAFDRKVKIEQKYNAQLKIVFVAGADPAAEQYRTAILAGDSSYDAGITTCTNFTSLLSGNFLTDWKDLTYVDMAKPYWNKNFYESMSIMGKHYAADGDISKRRLECVWIMAFNKSLTAANGFDSPYDLVKSGDWTYGKMHEMARSAAKDLNGDGAMELKTDLWGLNYTGDTIMGIINCSGVKIAEVNSEGIPELTVGTEVNLEKLFKIYTEMRDHTYSIDTLFQAGGGVTGLGDVDIFSENRCLFLACATHNIAADNTEGANNTNSLRAMDVDFGIIPYPKWDKAQADYMPHTAGNYHPVLTVPQTNTDLDNTGIILEAMAYEGMKGITPAFYENLLKTKTARDNESEEMIDYIFGNLSYDIGNMYNFGGIVGVFGYEMSTNMKMNIVSTIEKSSGKWGRAIDTVIAEIEKNS
jgi:hypothetical protein